MRDGHELKALQIGGPLGGILPASLLDTPFDFDDARRRVGCMVGHGGIVAFDERTDMRALARHLLHFGAHESCGKCFPCRIGLRRAHEMFAADAPVDRAPPRGAARGARAGQPVRPRRRHAGADPQPARALPRRAGAGADAGHGRRRRARGRGRARRVLEAVRAAGGWRADALLRRPPGAVRRLPRVPGRRGGRARPDPRLHDAVPRGHGDRHAPTRRARRVATAVVELVLSELPVAPAPHTELATVAALRWASSDAALAGRHPRRRPRRAPPLPGLPARAVHLLRALRARLRRGPGRVRPDGDRPRLHCNVTAGLDAGFRDSTCVSCGACADTCPTDAITEITLLTRYDRDETLRLHRHDDLRLLRRRLPPGGPRARRQDRLDQPGARRPRQRGPHLPEGPLRPPVLALARAPDGAADPRGRRASAWRAGRRRSTASPRELTRITRPARPRRDRRPGLLARDQRGLLRDGAPDARRDRHQQHRQLLARLPLADLVRAAQVVRPLRARPARSSDIDARRRRDPHRRQPDPGPPGRRRADQAGDAARPAAGHDRPAPDRARRLRRAAPLAAARHERRRDARARHVVRRDGLVDQALHRRAHRGLRGRSRSCSTHYTPDAVEEITGIPAADLERAAHIYARGRRARRSSGASA